MSRSSDERIRRSASHLRLLVFVTMAVIALLFAAASLKLQLGHVHFEYRSRDNIGSPYDPWIEGVGLALLLVALLRLTEMLGRIAGGELFSVEVVRRFRNFAFWLLLMAAFELLAPILAELAGASGGYPHRIALAVNFRDILTLGITLLLFLLASLLERARRLDEEVREFV